MEAKSLKERMQQWKNDWMNEEAIGLRTWL